MFNIKREVVLEANLFQAMTHSLTKNKLLQLFDRIAVRMAYIHFNRAIPVQQQQKKTKKKRDLDTERKQSNVCTS